MLDVQRSGGSWHLSGLLDAAGGLALLREVEQWRGDVRIDGSGLQRIDGAGLTALAVARQRCRAEGRTFALTDVATEALRELRVGAHLLKLFGPSPDADRSGIGEHADLHLRHHPGRRHDRTTR